VLGCKFVEGGVKLDVRSLGEAILSGTAHANIHVAVCPAFPDQGFRVLGNSAVQAVDDKLTGRTVVAAWMYYLDFASIRVLYTTPGYGRPLSDHWHPSTVGKLLRVARLHAGSLVR
jgi:hypothetical protein